MKTYPLLTLIADDSEDDRFFFGRAVRSLPDFRLAALTTDGLDTVAYLHGCGPYKNRSEFPYPDLILLDYQMPGFNGLEVLASMREAPQRPKVVLWSNTIDEVDKRMAYELGATLVCSKPTLSEEITGILKSVQPCPRDPKRIIYLPLPRRCRFNVQSGDWRSQDNPLWGGASA